MLSAEREATVRRLLDGHGEPRRDDAAALLAELDRLRSEGAAAAVALERLSAVLRAECEDAERLRGALASAEAASATYRQRCEELWSEACRLRDAQAENDKRVSWLANEAERKAAEADALRERLAAAERRAEVDGERLAEAESAVQRLEAENGRLLARREAAVDWSPACAPNVTSADAEVDRRRSSLDAERDRCLHFRECWDAEAEAAGASRAEMQRLADEMAVLRGRLAEAERRAAAAEDRAGAAEAALEASRAELRRLADEVRMAGAI